MFEQTLVTHAEKRPWTFFVSASGQSAVAALFVILPLFYTERISHQISVPVVAPLTPVKLQAEPQTSAPSTPPSSATPRPFVKPPITAPSSMPPAAQLFADPAPQIGGPATPSNLRGTESGVPGATGEYVPPPPAPKKDPPVEDKAPLPRDPINVSSGVQAAKLIKRVIPEYPVLAKQARVSGTVRLLAVVGRDGRVAKLDLVSGHPLLVRAALDAVKQWIYQPTLLSGKPVDVMAPIDVIFTLNR